MDEYYYEILRKISLSMFRDRLFGIFHGSISAKIKENQFFVNYARPGYISWYIELNNKEDLIKIKSKENLMRIKSGYESLENFNEVLAYTHMRHLRRKFLYDNCGNINFDIKVPARQELDMWIHGG